MTDIDDLLDDRMTGGGDYPDWWEPEESGDKIKGLVTEVRDDPWAEDDDPDPAKIIHVKRPDGEERSVRPHSILSGLIKDQNVERGDYVQIEYQGVVQTDSGHMANNYQLGLVKQAEIEENELDLPVPDDDTVAIEQDDESAQEPAETEDDESAQEDEDLGDFEDYEGGGSDTTDSMPEPSDYTVDELGDALDQLDTIEEVETFHALEQAGKDRKSAKRLIEAKMESLSDDESDEAEFDDEVIDFAENIVDFNENLEIEELDKYLNQVREFGVDAEAVAEAMGYDVEDGVIQT